MEKSIKQLFIDFILNRCNSDEVKQVRELIEAGGYEQEWRMAMEETEYEFRDVQHIDLAVDERKIFKKVKKSIAAPSSFTLQKPWNWVAAASLILMVTAGLLFIRSADQQAEQVTLKVKPLNTEHKWVKLPDGSSVQLNNDSHLDYPESFNGKANREVFLTGEGYFDIKHDAAHPFIIHTGKIKTTVLGTAFNISAYYADQAVTVTVARGKVRVEDEKKILAILTPDQQLVWNVKQTDPLKARVNAQIVIAWKKQDLIMDDITLEAAAEMIAERYGVKVQFNNEKVKTCRFTAAFLNRNDINQVLSVVSDITGATLILKNNLVIIDGPGC